MQTNAKRVFTHLLFVDTDGTIKVATGNKAQFATDLPATIALTQNDNDYSFSAANLPAAPDFTIDHVRAVIADHCASISEAFVALGHEPHEPEETLTSAVILAFLRSAVGRALAVAQVGNDEPPTFKSTDPSSQPGTTPQPEVTRSGAIDDGVSAAIGKQEIESLEGMNRQELLEGNKAALRALFALLLTKQATAIKDFEAWCRAERIWPEDGRFTPDVRRNVASIMLAKAEFPPKFGVGLHESVRAEEVAA